MFSMKHGHFTSRPERICVLPKTDGRRGPAVWLALALTACGVEQDPLNDGPSTVASTELDWGRLEPASETLTADEETKQILRPDGNLRAEWQVGGATAWTRLDDAITQPTAPAGADNAWAGGANRVLEVTLQQVNTHRGDAGKATAWAYANTAVGVQLKIEAVIGSQVVASTTLPSGASFRWFSLSLDLATRSVADDLRLRFTSLGGGDTNVRAAYALLEGRELSGTAPSATSPVAAPRPPSTGGLNVAVLGSAVKVRPTGTVSGAASAAIFAAKNEFEGFQVAVSAVGSALSSVSAAMTGPLTGPNGTTIPAGNVTLYREGYYNVATPSDLEGATGRWPDPMIPAVDPIYRETRNAFPMSIPSGENRVIWVDIQVPQNAVAGVYTGSLDVWAGSLSARIPVQLKVLNFALPSTSSLKTAFGYTAGAECGLSSSSCSTQEARAFAKQMFARTALDNRLTIAPAHVWHLDGWQGALTLFRDYTLPLVKGTGPTRLPGARLTSYRVNMTRDYNVGYWKAEAQLQGFENIAYVYGCDEPHYHPNGSDPAGNWVFCNSVLQKYQTAWPQVARMVTSHYQDARDNNGLALTDWMVPNQGWMHARDNARNYDPGNQRALYDNWLAGSSRRQVWLYTSCISHGCIENNNAETNGWWGYEIDAPAASSRAGGWLGFRYNVAGLLYYDTTVMAASAWDNQYAFTGNGDGTLWYLGTTARIGGAHPIPVESLRMKLLRDGMEDFEYLNFLRSRGLASQAQAIATSLFPAAYDTARSDAQIQAARKQLATLVAGLVGGPTP